MRGTQHDARRCASIQRLLPARRAQAPAVTRAKTGEAELRPRCRQIVAGRLAERQELLGHNRAYRMAARVFGTGVAAAVAKETGHWLRRAEVQNAAQHVA